MKKPLSYLLALALLAACEGPEGPVGPTGTTGTNGSNGTNGTNGANSLVALADADDHCPGGVMITTGLDTNGNGTLDESEVADTQYVCAGTGGSGPKELKFPLGVFGAGEDVVYNLLYEDFDMKNFEAYDSIVLVVKDVSVKISGGAEVDDQNLEFAIVNMSDDNAVVAGSEFTAKTGEEFASPNFSALLPTGAFDLGFSVKTENTGFSGTYKPILVLIDRD